jgi:pyruvate ferredoxin oxidoreductase gamma subunit
VIRVRFHGRGGHGVKTAGRILSTAAFLTGFEVQDAPIFGAERRGAPVTALTRISSEPIRERGAIDQPDLIVVADETLLDDATADILSSQSAVFVNAVAGSDFAGRHKVTTRLVCFDVSGFTIRSFGRAAALSAGLAAAAARLVGCIPPEPLLTAVHDELADLSVPGHEIEGNVRLAKAVYDQLPTVELRQRASTLSAAVHVVGYDDPAVATPSIFAAGNAVDRRTGAWRIERPEIDRERCTRCDLCLVRCPEGTIALDDRGYPVIDYDHCKGCMICWTACPVHAVTRRREVRAW